MSVDSRDIQSHTHTHICPKDSVRESETLPDQPMLPKIMGTKALFAFLHGAVSEHENSLRKMMGWITLSAGGAPHTSSV
eukprot:3861903-Amphidinium_carterae.1